MQLPQSNKQVEHTQYHNYHTSCRDELRAPYPTPIRRYRHELLSLTEDRQYMLVKRSDQQQLRDEFNQLNTRMQDLQITSNIQPVKQQHTSRFNTELQYFNNCIDNNPELLTYLQASNIQIPLKTPLQIDSLNQIIEKKYWKSKFPSACCLSTQDTRSFAEVESLTYTGLQNTEKYELLLLFKLKFGDNIKGLKIGFYMDKIFVVLCFFRYETYADPRLYIVKNVAPELKSIQTYDQKEFALEYCEIGDPDPILFGRISFDSSLVYFSCRPVPNKAEYPIYREEQTGKPYFTLGILYFHFHFDREVKKRHFYIHTPEQKRGQTSFINLMATLYRTYHSYHKTIADIDRTTRFIVIDNYTKNSLSYETIKQLTNNLVSFTDRYKLDHPWPTFIIMSKFKPEKIFGSEIADFKDKFNIINLEDYFQECRDQYRSDPKAYKTKEWHFAKEVIPQAKYTPRSIESTKTETQIQNYDRLKQTLITKLQDYIRTATHVDAQNRFTALNVEYVLTCADNQDLLKEEDLTNLFVEFILHYKHLMSNPRQGMWKQINEIWNIQQ